MASQHGAAARRSAAKCGSVMLTAELTRVDEAEHRLVSITNIKIKKTFPTMDSIIAHLTAILASVV